MNDPDAFLAEFNRVIQQSEVFTFITRDKVLQANACNDIKRLLLRVSEEKQVAIAAANEPYANILLGCECVATAVEAEINMWLLLKDGQPDKAWDQLVIAQSTFTAATRADRGFGHVDERVRRLHEIESLVFPPQVFLSVGLIVKSQICSICGQEYEDCSHIKGRPYMGRFCNVTLVPLAVDHVSFVDRPADKQCRVLQFSDEGGQRNRMTWRVDFSEVNDEMPPAGLKAEGILSAFSGPGMKDS